MVNRYPTSLASWSGLRNLATRLDCNLSGQGDGVSLGDLAVPALHLLLDRIEALEERVSDRLDAMDHRIESLVGRSIPATECAPEPVALRELRTLLAYAISMTSPNPKHSLPGTFAGFAECRRLMVEAIEGRIQALDRRDR